MEKDTILIVDDYEFNRMMLRDMFPDNEVIEAENGLQAVEEYEKNKDRICCILTDIMMPVMDGFTLLDYFFKNKYTNDIPIFIISADSSGKVLQRAYALDAEDVITKPFDINFTKKRILGAIELYTLRRILKTSGSCFDEFNDEI